MRVDCVKEVAHPACEQWNKRNTIESRKICANQVCVSGCMFFKAVEVRHRHVNLRWCARGVKWWVQIKIGNKNISKEASG